MRFIYHFLISFIACLLLTVVLHGKTTTVTSSSAFSTAVQNANPGDVIVIKNGTYTDFGHKTIDCEGTSENPIIIKSENKHGAVICGGRFTVTGKYITFKDLRSQNAAITFTISGSYIQVTGCYFSNNANDVIVIKNDQNLIPKYNSIDHNEIIHFKKMAILIRVNNVNQYPQHNTIEYNSIIDQIASGENADSLRIGTGTPKFAKLRLYTKIRYNYFEKINNCNEAISIKSSANNLIGNVVKNSLAGIWIRKGEDNIVEDNWIEDSDEGILVLGNNNRIMNNVVINSKYGIQLPYGQGYDLAVDRIPAPNNCIVANNTIYNCSNYGLYMSLWKNRDDWENNWPNEGRISDKPPKDNLIINNIIQGSVGTLFDNDNATSQNDITHQILYTTGSNYGYSGPNVIKHDPQFRSPPNDFYLKSSSPAVGSSRKVNPHVTSDDRGAIGDYPRGLKG